MIPFVVLLLLHCLLRYYEFLGRNSMFFPDFRPDSTGTNIHVYSSRLHQVPASEGEQLWSTTRLAHAITSHPEGNGQNPERERGGGRAAAHADILWKCTPHRPSKVHPGETLRNCWFTRPNFRLDKPPRRSICKRNHDTIATRRNNRS